MISLKNSLKTIILFAVFTLGIGNLAKATISMAFSTETDVNTTNEYGWDTTTNEDFACIVLPKQKQFILGEPVPVIIRLTNHMDTDVTVRDCKQHYPFYSFEINDPAWRALELSKELETSFAKLNPEFKTIEPNQSYDIEIDLAQWYDFSQPGRYSIKANWCCFMKRTPYERNSNAIPIIIAPKEQNDWFDPNQILFSPSWTNIPENWTQKILREKLAAYLKTTIEQDFKDITISTTDNGFHLEYHTRKYEVERPTSKSGTEKEMRAETGPEPDGLILDIWLSEQITQLSRPQLLDMTYWNLYATELYLPQMKLYLEANINYGSDFDEYTLAKYMNIADWMDDILKSAQ